jgi:hypothetical protein
MDDLATFRWMIWQLSDGLFGNFPMDDLATFRWMIWQLSDG